MAKKYIVAVSAAIILTAVSGYLFYIEDSTSNNDLEEVDFSTMKEMDIDIMEGVKERMNASASSEQATEHK